MSDQRSQREVIEAAVVEAVATVLHDHGPMNGPATERWQDCPNGEIHGGVADKVASTTVVQALLNVVEAAKGINGFDTECEKRCTSHCIHGHIAAVRSALARLPEEVRR